MGEILKDTRESWQRFSRTQKLAAVVTNFLTLSRPIIAGAVSRRGQDKTHEWTTGDAVLTGIGYFTDLEGHLARATGTQTRLGGVIDPIADKAAATMNELTLAKRGEESKVRLGIKLARDISISALRKYVLTKTNGEASVSAHVSGRANTVLRQGTNIFATSPLGRKYPRVRTGLQVASTVATVVSGAITANKLLKQIKK